MVVFFVLYGIVKDYQKRKKLKIQRAALIEKFNGNIIGFVDTELDKFVDTDKNIIPELADFYWYEGLDNCFAAKYIPWKLNLPPIGVFGFGGCVLMNKSYEFAVCFVSKDNVVLHSSELGDMIIPLKGVNFAPLRKKLQSCQIGNKFILPGGVLFDE